MADNVKKKQEKWRQPKEKRKGKNQGKVCEPQTVSETNRYFKT